MPALPEFCIAVSCPINKEMPTRLQTHVFICVLRIAAQDAVEECNG